MKKILNGLGVFGSIILTIALSILIFIYVVVLNIKFVVSENGMANTLKKIDVVETLKSAEKGTMWEDFNQLADTLNLSEEQFEQILNSAKVKEQIGSYIGEVLNSAFNDEEANLTKERMENFLNLVVDEYNKVSDIKISDAERQEIVDSFDEEMIANMNEEYGSINLVDTVSSEYVGYIKLADNLLFGNYTLILLVAIIAVIGMIALFRFSCYKWMPYVKMSTIISGSLMLIVGILLLIVPLQDMEIIIPLRNLLATRVFITSGILFILSVGLTVGKKYLKKYIDKKKEVTPLENMHEVSEKKEEVKQVDEKKKKKIELNKKTIIIIFLVLVILLIILFLIFERKESYTITFDTNGGTEITNTEVKGNEIVKLPEAPTRVGYVFTGWVDENGNAITKDTKVKDNMTIKATWKELYTCPSDCTPIEDGSKCTKTSTKDLVVYTGCPNGTETVEKFCSAHKRQVSVGFDEDQTYVDAGILCSGNPTNFCVDYNSRYTNNSDSCSSEYFKYIYSESGLDAVTGCAKKYDKGGSYCPNGYTRDGNKCIKTEIMDCTAN